MSNSVGKIKQWILIFMLAILLSYDSVVQSYVESASFSDIPVDAVLVVLSYLNSSSPQFNYLIRRYGLNFDLAEGLGKSFSLYIQNNSHKNLLLRVSDLDRILNKNFETLLESKCLKKDGARYHQTVYLINSVIRNKCLAIQIPGVGAFNVLKKLYCYDYKNIVKTGEKILYFLDKIKIEEIWREAEKISNLRESGNSLVKDEFISDIIKKYNNLLQDIKIHARNLKNGIVLYNRNNHRRYTIESFVDRIIMPSVLLMIFNCVSILAESEVDTGKAGLAVAYLFLLKYLCEKLEDRFYRIKSLNALNLIIQKIDILQNKINFHYASYLDNEHFV